MATPWVACGLKWLLSEGWGRGQIIPAFTRSAKYKDTLGGVGYIDANLAHSSAQRGGLGRWLTNDREERT
jgi:hypothetical protein